MNTISPASEPPSLGINSSAAGVNNKGLYQEMNGLFSSFLVPQSIQKKPQQQASAQLENTLQELINLIKGSLKQVNIQPVSNKQGIDLNHAAKEAGVNVTDLQSALNDLVKEVGNVINPKNNKLASLMKSAKNNLNNDDLQKAMQNMLELIVAIPVPSLLKLDQSKLKTALSTGGNLIQQAANLNLPLHQALQMLDVKNQLKDLTVKLEAYTKPLEMDKKNSILRTAFSSIASTAKSQMKSQTEEKESLPAKSAEKNSADFQTNPSNVMSKVEQYVIHTNKDGEGPSFEQFAKDFSSILSRSQFQKGANSNTLIIKLNPEHLGTLKVELVDQNGSITAKLIASNSTAKNMLDSQISQLKTAFSQQNIQVDKIDVSYSQADSADKEFNQQQFSSGQENKQEQHHQQQRRQHNSDEDFFEVLNENLIEKEN